ncbi:hypothetical protein DL93DRAFT_2052933 [Clavulina sp. PMI_390]|nr:hypothetical protein DL93DRAFT_2052933 [Clavulina sp. PMI_390]
MASPPSSIPHASGSNMSSLPAVWAYILPALDHIMRSDPDAVEAPALSTSYHMGVYTVVYNFATASKPESSQPPTPAIGGLDDPLDDPDDDPYPSNSMVGYELYVHLEDYFRGVARDVRLRAPANDSALLPYYLSSYARFSDALICVNRLFAYLNRHFVTRAVDEGMGWVSMQDVFKDKRPSAKKSKKDVELLEMKKREQLKTWGFVGGTEDQRRYAEACAEAGTPIDRIVPISSLALRCWRIEVVEPFLSAEKAKEKGKQKETPSDLGEGSNDAEEDDTAPPPIPPPPAPPDPRGRLNRVVGELVLTTRGPAAASARENAQKLSKSLRTCGVKPENIIRKRLDKFLHG